MLPCNNFLLLEFYHYNLSFHIPNIFFFRLRKLKISQKNTIVSFYLGRKNIIPFLILNLFSMIIDYQLIERRYQSVFDCVSNIKTWVYIFITSNLRQLTHNIRVRFEPNLFYVSHRNENSVIFSKKGTAHDQNFKQN